MFKKILVPMDSSKHSNNALDLALEIAEKFSVDIEIINVVPTVTAELISDSFNVVTPQKNKTSVSDYMVKLHDNYAKGLYYYLEKFLIDAGKKARKKSQI